MILYNGVALFSFKALIADRMRGFGWTVSAENILHHFWGTARIFNDVAIISFSAAFIMYAHGKQQLLELNRCTTYNMAAHALLAIRSETLCGRAVCKAQRSSPSDMPMSRIH